MNNAVNVATDNTLFFLNFSDHLVAPLISINDENASSRVEMMHLMMEHINTTLKEPQTIFQSLKIVLRHMLLDHDVWRRIRCPMRFPINNPPSH